MSAAVSSSPTTVRSLFWSAAAWTLIGLISGLGYREVTRHEGFEGRTQLAVAHTHALALGTLVLLVVLMLERVFRLSEQRSGRWFVPVWNVGLGLTVTMLVLKGYLQVVGSELVHPEAASSKAMAGVSGLGHIILSVGFVLLFLALRAQLATDGSGASRRSAREVRTGG